MFLSNEYTFKANGFANDWGSFIGGIGGGVIGGIITIIGVFLTVRSNQKTMNKQIDSNFKIATKHISSNKELLREQMKMQYLPVLSLPIIAGKSNFRAKNTIIRDLKFENDYVVNDGWVIKGTDKEVEDSIKFYIPICIKNEGNGTALNLQLNLYKILSIEGLDKLEDISNQTVDSIYDKCITENYIRKDDEKFNNDEWLMYPPYSLGKGHELNFIFNYQSNKDQYSLLKLSFEDALGNKYVQKIILIYTCGQLYSHAISKVYEV